MTSPSESRKKPKLNVGRILAFLCICPLRVIFCLLFIKSAMFSVTDFIVFVANGKLNFASVDVFSGNFDKYRRLVRARVGSICNLSVFQVNFRSLRALEIFFLRNDTEPHI